MKVSGFGDICKANWKICLNTFFVVAISLHNLLLEMIALSVSQSFTRILIHNAILFINDSTMLGTTMLGHWFIGWSYLAMLDGNAQVTNTMQVFNGFIWGKGDFNFLYGYAMWFLLWKKNHISCEISSCDNDWRILFTVGHYDKWLGDGIWFSFSA